MLKDDSNPPYDLIFQFCLSILQEDGMDKYPNQFVSNSRKWLINELSESEQLIRVLLELKNEDVATEILATKIPELEMNRSFMKHLTKRISDYIKFSKTLKKEPFDLTKTDPKLYLHDLDKKQSKPKSVNNSTDSGDIVIGNKITNNYLPANEYNPNENLSFEKAEKIKQKIIDGNLEEAVNSLLSLTKKAEHKHRDIAINLSRRLMDLKHKRLKSIFPTETIILERNKITVDILELLRLL
ncbi:MAG: hypothetical protein AAF798_10245 [Bacteroidota bacterium]